MELICATQVQADKDSDTSCATWVQVDKDIDTPCAWS